MAAETVSELRQRARLAGITGYSGMNKTQLTDALAAKERADNPLQVAPAGGFELTEIGVSYSYDIKANLGQQTYESASVHVSKSERFAVPPGTTPEEASFFWAQRYEALKAEIDPLVEEEYKNLSCFAE